MFSSFRTRVIVHLLYAGLMLAGADALATEATRPVDPELKALLKKAANESDSFKDRFDAVVWLADMSKRLEKKLPHPPYRVELLKNVHYEATRAGLQPEVVLAVIHVESDFNPYAISRVGARGLMQVMPFWMKENGSPGQRTYPAKIYQVLRTNWYAQ